MRTPPNRRVDDIANALHGDAITITHCLEHIATELERAGIYTADTLGGDRVSGGGVPSSPVESDAMLAVYELRSRREDLRDWIDGLVQYRASGRLLMTETLKLRTGRIEFAVEDHGTRCNGKIDPTCEQWAGEQRLPTGTTIDTLCPTCFAKACLVCGDEPASQRRVNGVRAGDRCWKQHYRGRIKSEGEVA
jgi:hypothetical protein